MTFVAMLLWLAPLCAGESSTAPADRSVCVLAGHWTYNAAKSRETDPDLRITLDGPGVLHAESASMGSYDFDLMGGSFAVSNGSTISWVATGRDAWRVTRSRNGIAVETLTVKLSGEILRIEAHGKLPNGSPYERTVTYRRARPGKGLVGRWQAIKVDRGATWDGFVISTDSDGVVTWRIPTDLQLITGHFDGSDLAIVGPKGPTGSTIAVRAAGARRFDYVIKSGDRVTEHGSIAISPDRHWLTEINWSVEEPDRKSRLIYERDQAGSDGND
jgi:hypothetical protein